MEISHNFDHTKISLAQKIYMSLTQNVHESTEKNVGYVIQLLFLWYLGVSYVQYQLLAHLGEGLWLLAVDILAFYLL